MIKRYFTFFNILIFLSSMVRAELPSGPFAPEGEEKNQPQEYTGPFQPEVEKHDPHRFLTDYVYPFAAEEDAMQMIQVSLEDTSLGEIASFIEDAFNIKFIFSDTVKPAEGAQPVPGTPQAGPKLETIKVNFKTNRSMSKKELWDLFITFTDIAGAMVSPGPEPRTYLIGNTMPVNNGIRVPLPTYLGTNPAELPDNDMKIRYLYFVENSSVSTIAQVINSIRSAGAANVEKFEEVNGILITEKASNIKAMMAIIKEIDRAAMPEAMSILKLNRADANEVAKLYTELIGAGKEQQPIYGRPRKPPSGSYFPPNMKIIAEPRSNTLILLGTPEAINKVEMFIKEHVDTEIEKPYSPLHTYYLKFADATAVAKYLNQVVEGQQDIDKTAAQFGGVRDGDKLLAPMKFVAEVTTNMLLILGDYDDYLKVYELLQQIDVEQPQVIIRVMVLTVDLTNTKELGTQIRNKNTSGDPCEPSTRDVLGKNTNFQFAGLGPIVQNDNGGATRLLGDLIQLAQGNPVGTLAVTLGKDAFGIWGFLKLLDTLTKINIVDTPFLIATHKTPAQIISGETRRVQEAEITSNTSQSSFSTMDANLEVNITPLISTDGLIRLEIQIRDDEFTTSSSANEIDRGNTITRVVNTEALLFDKEVLAVGGIVRSSTVDTYQRIPILGDIPLIGWLFKSKTQIMEKNSLVILISPEIIKTHNDEPVNDFTAERLADMEETFCQMDHIYQQRDPGHRWFFGDHSYNEHSMIDAFLPGEPSAHSEEGAATLKERAQAQEKRRTNEQNALLKQVREKQQKALEEKQAIPDPSQDQLTNISGQAQDETPLQESNETVSKTKTMMRKRSKKKLADFVGGGSND